MTDKELIKKEIERIEQILDDFNKTHNNTIDNGVVSAKKNICKHIKSFIDSLSEEDHFEDNSEMVSEGLEEAAKHYLYGAVLYDDVYVGNPTEEDCIRCFKAGAEWQKKKDFQDFLEKAEEFFNSELYVSVSNQICSQSDFTSMTKFIEQFKNYMQDEM